MQNRGEEEEEEILREEKWVFLEIEDGWRESTTKDEIEEILLNFLQPRNPAEEQLQSMEIKNNRGMLMQCNWVPHDQWHQWAIHNALVAKEKIVFMDIN